MKRGLVVAGAIGALMFATAAFAATKSYTGKDTDSQCGMPNVTCDISFSGVIRQGKVKTVRGFSYTGIPMQCTQGNFTVSSGGNPLPDMKVNTHRKFAGHFHTVNNLQFIDVTGRFSKSWKKASGTLRVHGDFGTGASNCDTGTDNYHVAR